MKYIIGIVYLDHFIHYRTIFQVFGGIDDRCIRIGIIIPEGVRRGVSIRVILGNFCCSCGKIICLFRCCQESFCPFFGFCLGCSCLLILSFRFGFFFCHSFRHRLGGVLRHCFCFRLCGVFRHSFRFCFCLIRRLCLCSLSLTHGCLAGCLSRCGFLFRLSSFCLRSLCAFFTSRFGFSCLSLFFCLFLRFHIETNVGNRSLGCFLVRYLGIHICTHGMFHLMLDGIKRQHTLYVFSSGAHLLQNFFSVGRNKFLCRSRDGSFVILGDLHAIIRHMFLSQEHPLQAFHDLIFKAVSISGSGSGQIRAPDIIPVIAFQPGTIISLKLSLLIAKQTVHQANRNLFSVQSSYCRSRIKFFSFSAAG